MTRLDDLAFLNAEAAAQRAIRLAPKGEKTRRRRLLKLLVHDQLIREIGDPHHGRTAHRSA